MHEDEGTEQSTTEEEFQRAVELLGRGHNGEALRILLPLIEQDPDHADALNKAGVAYAGLKEMVGAENCFLRAIIANPRHVAALSNLGNIYLDRDDTTRAIALYKKAIKYEPDYSAAHNNIAAAYRRTGERGKQVEHFKKSQRLKVKSQESQQDEVRRPWTRRRARTADNPSETDQAESGGAADAGRRRGCLGGTIIGVMLIVTLLIIVL